MYEDMYKDYVSAAEEERKAKRLVDEANAKLQAAREEKWKIGAEVARIYVFDQFGLKIGDVVEITRKTWRNNITFRMKITRISGGFHESYRSDEVDPVVGFHIKGIRILKSGKEGVKEDFFSTLDKWTKIPETEVSHE